MQLDISDDTQHSIASTAKRAIATPKAKSSRFFTVYLVRKHGRFDPMMRFCKWLEE